MTGVAGIYPGGALWGIRRHDVGDEPVVMRIEQGETLAREWFRDFYRLWEASPWRDEQHPPELVAARIHWQVQE